MTALIVLEAVVIVLLVVLVAGLLRSHAEILRQLHELGAGEPQGAEGGSLPFPGPRRRQGLGEVSVEAVTGATPTGGSVSVSLIGSRGLVLVAFLSSGCTTCRALWGTSPDAGDLARPDLRTVIVTRGVEEESPGAVANLAVHADTVVMSTETWDAFRAPVSPYFALVDAASGTVLGEGAAASWPQVADLVGRALADGETSRSSSDGGGSTAARLRDTDEELRRAGITPGDPTLYRAPADGEPT